MAFPILVDDLLSQVRSQISEENTDDLSDATLLQAMNRGQQKLVRLASRKYDNMFMRETTLTADGSSREIAIPEAAFGLIIDQVDIMDGSTAYPVVHRHPKETSILDNTSTSARPQVYAIRGNKLLFYPKPAGNTNIRVRFQTRPPTLVTQEGRIVSIDTGTNILGLDAIGSNLTTSVTALKCFINIIDAQTGLIKMAAQISAIDTTAKTITLKSSGLNRSSVYGTTIAIAIDTTVELDDYVCLIWGTCIPELVSDYSDYLIQYAVVEARRRSGEPIQEELTILQRLEDDILKMWSGREKSRRIVQKNRHWGTRLSLLHQYNS